VRKPINSMLIYRNIITETGSSFYVRHLKLQNWGIRAKSSYKLTSEMCKNASDS